ncbi:DUF5658 family protein [Chloroflexota bacterium]
MISTILSRKRTWDAPLSKDAAAATPQLRKPSSLDYRLFIAWMGLNVFDAIATYIVLSGGGMEINPVASLVIEHLQLVPALIVKVIAAVPVGILILRWKHKLLLALNILMAGVVTLTATSIILPYIPLP